VSVKLSARSSNRLLHESGMSWIPLLLVLIAERSTVLATNLGAIRAEQQFRWHQQLIRREPNIMHAAASEQDEMDERALLRLRRIRRGAPGTNEGDDRFGIPVHDDENYKIPVPEAAWPCRHTDAVSGATYAQPCQCIARLPVQNACMNVGSADNCSKSYSCSNGKATICFWFTQDGSCKIIEDPYLGRCDEDREHETDKDLDENYKKLHAVCR